MRRTQRGNNNAYCQDSEVSWVDWRLLDRHPDLHRFVRMALAARLQWREWIEGREEYGLSLTELLRRARFHWSGTRLDQPDWGDDSHSLACTVRSGPGRLPVFLHVMFNAHWEALDFELPPRPADAASGWRRWVDTALESPEDIVDISASAPAVPGTHYRVMPRSIAMLFLPFDARCSAGEDERSGEPNHRG
jgi:glycogen operon protein